MSRSRFRGALPLALVASFGAGVLVDGWLRTSGPPKPAQTMSEEIRLTDSPVIPAAPAPHPSSVISDSSPAVVSGVSRTMTGTAGELSHSHSPLRVPIDGEDIESFKGGFGERRGNRPHEAVDMLAPRNTPVHAVENGTIAKLFTSKAGGLTVYQFDPSGRVCYYYAHLERYADGLKDGQSVWQGDVIGYVGTTGNAPPNTPHLHFAVFELNADRHWWQGRAIDPYRVFKEKG
jgi:murein DD-endopeptidase MepM/ murein hydrolase activator NlpD